MVTADLQDVRTLVRRAAGDVGEPNLWKEPDGYPNSLAMCLIDAIWSLSLRYEAVVVPVLNRYRAYRLQEGSDADSDGLSDLLGVYQRVGSDEEFAERIGTRNRTSTTPGAPLKATAVRLAAEALHGPPYDLETPADLIAAVSHSHLGLKAAWRSLPGQRSSWTGWRYFLLLAGVDQVKPDRMILRYVERALGRRVSEDYAVEVVSQAATQLGVRATQLDHAIWNHESSNLRR